jgi:hypothetical protein
MTRVGWAVVAAGLWLGAGGAGGAKADAPSYAKHVKPFLEKYCVQCHRDGKTKGRLNMETYRGMLRGGKKASGVVPGKPDRSRVLLTVEGKAKPRMPPRKAKSKPTAAEVARVRKWIAAGAKDDSSDANQISRADRVKPSNPPLAAPAPFRKVPILALWAGSLFVIVVSLQFFAKR